MKSVQKVLLSLLFSTLIAGAFIVAGVLGVFDSLEYVFYESRIQNRLETDLSQSANILDFYKADILARTETLGIDEAFYQAYLINQTTDLITRRRELIQEAFQLSPGLTSLRIFQPDLSRMYYSTRISDSLESGSQRIVYRPVDQIEDLEFLRNLLVDISEDYYPPIFLIQSERQQFYLIRPIIDDLEILRGHAVFLGNFRPLENRLIQAGLLSVDRGAFFLSDSLFLFNSTDSIRQSISPADLNFLDNEEELFGRLDLGGQRYVLISTKSSSFTLATLIPENELVLSDALKAVLVGLIWSSSFLLIFLLVNLRHDSVVVITDRIKRFQIGLVQEYLESKQDFDVQKWKNELRLRKDDVFGQILKGLPKGQKNDPSIQQLMESSWEEILEVLGSKKLLSGTSQLDIDRIEQAMQRVVSSLQNANLSPTAGDSQGSKTAMALPSPTKSKIARPIPVGSSMPIDLGKDDAEELEDLEELGSGGVDSRDAQESEEPEELEELEDLEELGSDGAESPDAQESEEPEELEELEDLEELGSDGADSRDAQESAEPEELEELEDLEELGSDGAESRDAQEPEEPEELEELEDLQNLEEAEEVPEAEEVEEVEEIEELDPNEEEADDADELEEVVAQSESATTKDSISKAPRRPVVEEEYENLNFGALEILAEGAVNVPVLEQEIEELEELDDEDAEELEALEEETVDQIEGGIVSTSEAWQPEEGDDGEEPSEVLEIENVISGGFLNPIGEVKQVLWSNRMDDDDLDFLEPLEEIGEGEAIIPEGDPIFETLIIADIAHEQEDSVLVFGADGVVEISDSTFAKAAVSPVEHEDGESIEDLFQLPEIDLGLENFESDSGLGKSRLRRYRKKDHGEFLFGPNGLDFDVFAEPFRNDGPGRVKALVTLSRLLNSRFAAIFTLTERGMFYKAGVGYTREVDPISPEDALLDQYLKSDSATMVTNIKNYLFFMPQHEQEIGSLNQLVFLPCKFEDEQGFLVFGPSAHQDSVGDFISLLKTLSE